MSATVPERVILFQDHLKIVESYMQYADSTSNGL